MSYYNHRRTCRLAEIAKEREDGTVNNQLLSIIKWIINPIPGDCPRMG